MAIGSIFIHVYINQGLASLQTRILHPGIRVVRKRSSIISALFLWRKRLLSYSEKKSPFSQNALFFSKFSFHQYLSYFSLSLFLFSNTIKLKYPIFRVCIIIYRIISCLNLCTANCCTWVFTREEKIHIQLYRALSLNEPLTD